MAVAGKGALCSIENSIRSIPGVNTGIRGATVRRARARGHLPEGKVIDGASRRRVKQRTAKGRRGVSGEIVRHTRMRRRCIGNLCRRVCDGVDRVPVRQR